MQHVGKPGKVAGIGYGYWAGYYWGIQLKEKDGKLALFAHPSVRPNESYLFKEDCKLPGVQVGALEALSHPIHMHGPRSTCRMACALHAGRIYHLPHALKWHP